MIHSFQSFVFALVSNPRNLDAYHRTVRQLDPVKLSVEAALIAAAAVLTFWLRHRLHGWAKGVLVQVAPAHWREQTTHAFAELSGPVFWLFTLWLADLTGAAMGYNFGLLGAVISLLAAWVTIRMLSFAVSNPMLSATISVVAWSLAALSILGLLHPLALEMDKIDFEVGHLRLTLLTVVRAMIVLVVLLWATMLLSRYLERRISNTQSLDPSLQTLLIRLLNIMLPAVAILIGLEAVGIDFTALTVLSGAIGIGIGLGLQKTVSNFVAGMTLIIGKSIKPGDVVAYKNTYGWVTSMGARFITIATRDGSEYLVPNEDFITNGVENWSYSNNLRRLHIPFGVGYDSDMHEVIDLSLRAVRSVDRILQSPAPACLMTGFGDSSVNFEIRCWINDPKNGVTNAKSAVLLALWDIFQAHHITLPFPQRDLHIVSSAPDFSLKVDQSLSATTPPLPEAVIAS